MRSPERRGEQGNRRRQHGVKGGPGGARIGIVSQEGRRGDRKQQEEGQDAERQTGHQRVAAGPDLRPISVAPGRRPHGEPGGHSAEGSQPRGESRLARRDRPPGPPAPPPRPPIPSAPASAFSRLNTTSGVTTEGTSRHPLGRWPRNSEASRIEAKDRRTCGAKVNPT